MRCDAMRADATVPRPSDAMRRGGILIIYIIISASNRQKHAGAVVITFNYNNNKDTPMRCGSALVRGL